MPRFMRKFLTRSGRAAKSEDGASTIEFVILFPFFIILVCSSIEMGVLMIRNVMLERALDLSVRGLRLGVWTPPTHEELKRSICNNAAILPDCMDTLLVELRVVSTETWQPLTTQATCVDRSEEVQPVTSVDAGTENDMMLVRACSKFKPMFHWTSVGQKLPTDNNGDYALVSTTAFVNEPS
jgi:Flp pilus assembly protein TadG